MDNFDDAFGGSPPAAGEVDPAAEFLAKEQEELADLGEDLGFSSPPHQENEESDIKDETSNSHEQSYDFLADSAQDQEEIPVVSLVEETQKQDGAVSFLDEDFGLQADNSSLSSSFNPFAAQQAQEEYEGVSKGFSAMSMREEPESIKRWKVEQEERLKVKDAEEETKKQELKEKAQKELEDWYKRYEEQLTKTKATNRNAQEEFVAEINNIVPGSEWERVARHCDFNPKSTRHTKDVSRMRSLLLQLKQTPPARD